MAILGPPSLPESLAKLLEERLDLPLMNSKVDPDPDVVAKFPDGHEGGIDMDLLFKREQTPGKLGRVSFKLWGKIELNEDEQAIVKRYRFDDAVLIEAIQPTLIRNTLLVALAAGGVGYWYFNEKRETIFVKDLLHGRHFTCPSVIELARKEAWLSHVVAFLRQVMESAKHWDGTQRHEVEPLPKDEARQVIIRGL
ncbi:MAG: hypothetical protein RIF44_16235 [Nitratireductor sp.]